MRIVFRADGNNRVGLGHVFRLLSLVEVCKNYFDCIFLIQTPDQAVLNVIKTFCELYIIPNGKEMEVIQTTVLPTDIIVIDGYQFDSEYQKKVKSYAHKLVVIDDDVKIHFYADLIINHGGEYVKKKYSKEPYTKVLAGFPYLLVRKEFMNAARGKRFVSKVDTAFICMGGADPFNVTLKALQACVKSKFIKKIFVVTGLAYKTKTELSAFIEKYQDLTIIVHEENVSAERMVELIKSTEIAISTASSIAMELCCVKVGLITGLIADNQCNIQKQLLSSGCCVSLGYFEAATIDEILCCIEQFNDIDFLKTMIENQMNAIDGHSGDRLLKEIKILAAC